MTVSVSSNYLNNYVNQTNSAVQPKENVALQKEKKGFCNKKRIRLKPSSFFKSGHEYTCLGFAPRLSSRYLEASSGRQQKKYT